MVPFLTVKESSVVSHMEKQEASCGVRHLEMHEGNSVASCVENSLESSKENLMVMTLRMSQE